MHLADGIQTGLSWPTIELRAGADHDGHDVLFLIGAEPDHSWRAFSDAVVDLAIELGARHDRRPRRLPGPGPPHPPDPGGRPPPARASWPTRSAPSRAASTCPPACRPPSRSRPTSRACPRSACGPRSPTTPRPCPTRPPAPPCIETLGAGGRAAASTPGTLADDAAAAREPPRRAHRRQRRAPAAGAPARGAGRRPGRAPTARPLPRARSWPPSSSATSATRTTPDRDQPRGPAAARRSRWPHPDGEAPRDAPARPASLAAEVTGSSGPLAGGTVV